MVISVRNISTAQWTECNTKHTGEEDEEEEEKTPSKKFNCVKKKRRAGGDDERRRDDGGKREERKTSRPLLLGSRPGFVCFLLQLVGIKLEGLLRKRKRKRGRDKC